MPYSAPGSSKTITPDSKAFLRPRIGRIVLVLPDQAPAGQAFLYAVEWARQLDLPVHEVFLRSNSFGAVVNENQLCERAKVCVGCRIAWSHEILRWEGGPFPDAVLKGSDLCIVNYESIAACKIKVF
jgi:hypothetical protein